MPIYSYRCTNNHTFDKFATSFNTRAEALPCPTCDVTALRTVTMPAKTAARWGDSAGYFDRGLGRHISNSAQRDQIMKERNLVPESDLRGDTFESGLHAAWRDAKDHEADMARYNARLHDSGGDVGIALAETFPSEP